MKLEMEIRLIGKSQEKELWIDDNFYASWDNKVDDFKIIVPYALREVYELGKRAKTTEIKKVLNISLDRWDLK